MKTLRPFRPHLEQLEGRIVPVAVLGSAPANLGMLEYSSRSPAPLALEQQHHQDPAFDGNATGTWTVAQPIAADVGTTQTLAGSGTIAILGAVQGSGTLHTPGFIVRGYTTGTMVFSNAQGSITLSLIGQQPQPGFSPPPSAFNYSITGGKGAYAGASGSGVATLTETPPGQSVPGQFTMTFKGSISVPAPAHSVSGIRGVAMAGPIYPVSRPGEPNERPLAGAIITVHPANGGPEITRVVADQRGRFYIDLAPGSYLLVPLAPTPGVPWPRGLAETVVVMPDGLTRVVVNYDTGIR
jgi:hypothetical protein